MCQIWIWIWIWWLNWFEYLKVFFPLLNPSSSFHAMLLTINQTNKHADENVTSLTKVIKLSRYLLVYRRYYRLLISTNNDFCFNLLLFTSCSCWPCSSYERESNQSDGSCWLLMTSCRSFPLWETSCSGDAETWWSCVEELKKRDSGDDGMLCGVRTPLSPCWWNKTQRRRGRRRSRWCDVSMTCWPLVGHGHGPIPCVLAPLKVHNTHICTQTSLHTDTSPRRSSMRRSLPDLRTLTRPGARGLTPHESSDPIIGHMHEAAYKLCSSAKQPRLFIVNVSV